MAARKTAIHWAAVTANDLRSGDVVFRRADGSWSRDVAEAHIVEGAQDAAAWLALAQQDHAACRVVEPVLIAMDPATRLPVLLRERIRATGPQIAA